MMMAMNASDNIDAMTDFNDNNNPFLMDDGAVDSRQTGSPSSADDMRPGKRFHPFKLLFSLFADACIIGAVLCGCYFLWLQVWTGVESVKTQTLTSERANWKNADAAKIAKPQQGDPPVQPENPKYGDLLGQIYIPRFGDQWNRNLTEGTDWEQLGRHGIGHYINTALPGQIGLFAVAGHVNGYGQPLAQLDTLTDGDYVIMRTQDYWYVYKYEKQQIVDKDASEALAPVPFNPGTNPTERLMALTTCWPKYWMGPGETPQRRIAYAKFAYWAKVSDGVPKELVRNDNIVNSPSFIDTATTGMAKYLPDMAEMVKILSVVYVILFIASAFAWRFPGIKRWHDAYIADRTTFSITGWMYRIQPGPRAMQVMLTILLTLIIVTALIGYACPWAAGNIPALRVGAAMDV